MRHEIDPQFLDLPLAAVADAALGRARKLGAQHASVRVDRLRTARLLLHDAAVQARRDITDTGVGIRVLRDGRWGFAAASDLTPEAAAAAASRAVEVARQCAAIGSSQVGLAAEPVYPGATWISSYRINPFDIPEAGRAARLAELSGKLLTAPEIDHVLAYLTVVQENKFYADLAGTTTTQQRVRVHPMLVAQGVHTRTGASAMVRTQGPPTGRGWEYLLGEGWDWDSELAAVPSLVAGKLRASPVRGGRYDLVIDASNLWLTIHESVGHATELDRALNYELSYTGGTFATVDDAGSLWYGSPLMNVDADRTTEHGLATTGFDDEGVAAQSWTLVENGVLVGFQTDRRTAQTVGEVRSTGCAFAESAMHVPLQRMANVGLRPLAGGPAVEDLIGAVENGIYISGSGSWSIDMRRENFQFGSQCCHRIRSGRLDGQLSGVAYRGSTTAFWSSLTALGGEETYALFGADLCGKGRPLQLAAASHGCPAAVFRGIHVINTDEEGCP